MKILLLAGFFDPESFVFMHENKISLHENENFIHETFRTGDGNLKFQTLLTYQKFEVFKPNVCV